MEAYIALLRGVNVGGNNKVPMPLLQTAFEQAGLAQVRTYINSGNVLFSAQGRDTAELQRTCRQLIADRFQLDIPVAVIPAGEYDRALNHAPPWWDGDPSAKHNAIFVIPPAAAADVVEAVGAKPEYEQVAFHGQVIFWSAPLKTYSRTRWSKVPGTPAYGHITIRNANTAKRLLQLCRE